MEENTRVVFSREDKQMTITFQKDISEVTLKEAREQLVQDGFFLENNQDRSSDYRYVYPEVEIPDDQEYMAYSDRVVGKSSERDICLKRMLLKSGNEVVLANVNTNKSQLPDLIGFRTGFWGNDELQVTCRLRTGYNDPSVPEPFLLTDVISTKEKDYSKMHIPNALICVQNSVIEFPMACKCTVGMSYSAWINGQRMFDYAVPLPPYHSHEIAIGTVDCFNNGRYSNEQDGPKAITVEKLSAEDASSPELISYDITFTADDVTQWSAQKNGVTVGTYTENTQNPARTMTLHFAKSQVKVLSGSAGTQQVVLDSKSYFKGKVLPGVDVPKRLPGVDTFSVDKSGKKIGSVRVKILVFKDMETAKRFVGRYNPIV